MQAWRAQRAGFPFATSLRVHRLTDLLTAARLEFDVIRRTRVLMPTVDEELSQIEKDIRALKIEYEQYFGGGRKRPPADTQWRVEALIRRYNERSADLNYGQRFRFNNLAQTYAKYQEIWRKKLAQKETGAVQKHFGAAAKAVEAERAARHSAEHQHVQTDAIGTGSAPPGVSQTSIFARSFSDPANENSKIMELYDKLVQARTEAGEKSSIPSLRDFEKFVQQKTQELKNKGGREVEYSVSVEGGRVKLKARISA